jgi:protocatechuate 3,4-dioxygenase beta subunit
VETADGRHPHATSTDAQGQFSFPDILPGTYEVRAYWDGAWSEWQHNLIVRAGKTTEITLRVSVKKPSTGYAARD